jgi:antitoxin (DNA-binding transcriptional repressor) of toxin-antitoxin stability system
MSDALDRVRRGEEVTISDHGQAIAKLVPVGSTERVFGDFQGKIHMSDDFTAPLTEAELAEWEK